MRYKCLCLSGFFCMTDGVYRMVLFVKCLMVVHAIICGSVCGCDKENDVDESAVLREQCFKGSGENVIYRSDYCFAAMLEELSCENGDRLIVANEEGALGFFCLNEKAIRNGLFIAISDSEKNVGLYMDGKEDGIWLLDSADKVTIERYRAGVILSSSRREDCGPGGESK